MKFTTDPKHGYRNATSCFKKFAKMYATDGQQISDQIEQLEDLYKYKASATNDNLDYHGIHLSDINLESIAKQLLRLGGKRQESMFGYIAWQYHEQHKWFLRFEDDYECSGMCNPSLFYFGKDIDEGKPEKTCLKKMKEQLSGETRAFAIFSVLSGITGFILFASHIGLYNRPERNQDYIEEQELPTGTQATLPGNTDTEAQDK
jgi:hypothetical protein